MDQTQGGAGRGVGRGIRDEMGPEEERLDVRVGEHSVRKNQCDSLTPLGEFSVFLFADGMVPETPLEQKDPV